MSKKLAEIFEGKNLQAAADQILTDIDTPQARIDRLNKLIAGEENPTFDESASILAWAKKQKKSADTGVKKSSTVSTPDKLDAFVKNNGIDLEFAEHPRRPTAGMTW